MEINNAASPWTSVKEYDYITDRSVGDTVRDIKLNGNAVSLPFTAEELGEGYSAAEKIIELNGARIFNIYYKDIVIAKVDFSDDNFILEKRGICSIFVTGDDFKWKLDGFAYGAKMKKVMKKYGEPTVIAEKPGEAMVIYLFADKNGEPNGGRLMLVFKNDRLYGFQVIDKKKP